MNDELVYYIDPALNYSTAHDSGNSCPPPECACSCTCQAPKGVPCISNPAVAAFSSSEAIPSSDFNSQQNIRQDLDGDQQKQKFTNSISKTEDYKNQAKNVDD